MKKLYKKGKVHPSPPLISDHLSFLPATILTLTVALSPQDREVLAYLLSCSASSPTTNFSTSSKKTSNNKNFNGVGRCGSVVGSGGTTEHPPLFYCNCFRCYTSYWVRWDASPNRQLIHDIIDAFEDELSHQNKKKKKNNNNKKNKKERKKKRFEDDNDDDDSNQVKLSESVVANSCVIGDEGSSGSGDDGEEQEEDGDFEKGSVRKFVSFLGETIWGVWN